MGFTLGGVDELVDPRVKLLYAVDTDGKVLGVTSWLPTYENGKVVGWTLDFMRHRTDSVNGIMEFLTPHGRTAARRRRSAIHEPVRGATCRHERRRPRTGGERRARPRAADGGRHHGTGLRIPLPVPLQTQFHPDEAKVYICYPDPAKLPQISLAVAQAYVPSLTPAEAMRFVRTIVPTKMN
mgnify:CR=1 FL=1